MKSEGVLDEMEVTPHLKSVLKNYQHSATKSLQGPGFALVHEIASEKEDDLPKVSAPFAIQQLPILSAADTTCSDLSETVLEGENISCFVVGGEMRLCLPQVLNWVLRNFSVAQINAMCDSLFIYCSRCTPEQLNVLKTQGGLPSNVPSCGLIRKTDAQRLCSALLHQPVRIRIPKGMFSFGIYHECFGRCAGICIPDLYTSKNAACIECLDCHGAFAPHQFVCHVHQNLENRTLHWGFDSDRWRCYLYVSDDEDELYAKYLDEMQEQFEEKVPFRIAPQVIVDHYHGVNNLKRKQIHQNGPELILDDLAIKKYRLDETKPHLTPVYAIPVQATQLEYLKCLQAFPGIPSYPNRTLSAFKPISQLSQDGRMRHGTLYDQPVLQYPEKLTQRAKGDNYQPNVALAPTKKRYLKRLMEEEASNSTSEVSSTKENGFHHIKDYKQTVIKHEKDYDVIKQEQKSPDSQNIIDSTVSVVQTTGSLKRYNSEIELSTDTDDSGSEINEKSNLYKLEEITKDIDPSTREKILEVMRKMSREFDAVVTENRNKDDRIAEITNKLSNLENELIELKALTSKGSPLREEVDDDEALKETEEDGVKVDEIKVEDDATCKIEEEETSASAVEGKVEDVQEVKDDIVKTEPE